MTFAEPARAAKPPVVSLVNTGDSAALRIGVVAVQASGLKVGDPVKLEKGEGSVYRLRRLAQGEKGAWGRLIAQSCGSLAFCAAGNDLRALGYANGRTRVLRVFSGMIVFDAAPLKAKAVGS